jgi:2,3-bisphosphoglycerate-independent phosphoglycerate mutase
MKKSPVILCILDGLGLRKDQYGNALKHATTPNLDFLLKRFPNSTLETHGISVGLPEGQMGNSEVGHLNIGSGRVVKAMLPRIDQAIVSGELENNKILGNFLSETEEIGGNIHIAGLFSEGGVHGHRDHLIKLMHIASKKNISVKLHLFADGRDVSSKSGIKDLKIIQSAMTKKTEIVTVMGRYYAMDRDTRWDRTERAYQAIISGTGRHYDDPLTSIHHSYKLGITDEFIEPSVINGYGGLVDKKDHLIFCNFRADRARQLLASFITEDFENFSRPPDIGFKNFLGMIDYGELFRKDIGVLFKKNMIVDSLGEWIEKNNLKQFRVAETEKYPHVTYFFNGGVEKKYKGEDRALIPSPNVSSYEKCPEMSAEAVCNKLLSAISLEKYDLLIVNFANPDMVGHTGNLRSAKIACETIDKMLGKILKALKCVNGEMLVISDHGNCEEMFIKDTDEAHTFHTLNPVPCILYSSREKLSLSPGNLSDIAPTILELMGLKKPKLMDGKSLIRFDG